MRSLGEAEPGGICPLLRWAIVFDYAAVCLNALIGQNRRGPAINVLSCSLRRARRGISLWQDAVSSVWFVQDIFTQKQTNTCCVFGVCTEALSVKDEVFLWCVLLCVWGTNRCMPRVHIDVRILFSCHILHKCSFCPSFLRQGMLRFRLSIAYYLT